MDTWQSRNIKLLVTYGLTKSEAKSIVQSFESAFHKYVWRFHHIPEILRWQDQPPIERKKRAAIWEWKVSRGYPSEAAIAEVKKAVERKDTDFLIQLGKVLKEKPHAWDKVRWIILLRWTSKFPPPTGWPPLCLWTDEAIVDFANAIIGGKCSVDQLRKIRRRELQLVKAKRPLVRRFISVGDKVGVEFASG